MSDTLRKLYIEPTSSCNLNCKMCFRNSWINEEIGTMDMDLFDKIMDTMPESVETVFFGGMGEPLNCETIVEMVKKAKDKRKRVELLTNGTLLTKDMSKALIKAGLNKLWVSIDSLDAKNYEDIRKNSNYKTVLENVKQFNMVRQYIKEGASAVKKVRLGFAFVAMKSNVSLLPDMPLFAAQYGADDVNISNVIPSDEESLKEVLYTRLMGVTMGVPSMTEHLPMVKLPMLDFNLPEAMQAIEGLLKSQCCNLTFSDKTIERKINSCKFIDEGTTFVKYDGEVCPCMSLLHSSTTFLFNQKRTVYSYSYGNVKDISLTNIWNSENYTQFRQRVRDFTFSPCVRCGGCDNWLENKEDCYYNPEPTCGGCLWSEGLITCP